MKLRTLLIDDERLARENLRSLLEQFCSAHIDSISMASSAEEAMDLMMLEDFDLLLLDIKMPDIDGFEFLEKVSFLKPKPALVFVTAFSDFGIKAVKASALDYLTKPIDPDELQKACQKALSLKRERKLRPQKQSNRIAIPKSNGIEILAINEIVSLKADGCYTLLKLSQEGNRLVSKTLKEFEKALPQELFFRPHNSHMINLNYMSSYTTEGGSTVILTNGEKVPIAKRKLLDFKRKLEEFCTRPGM
ncbi:LytR/AlgR family response regulator transcription factor [Croceimicrobium sp.]|uniref:LytR/AlgR family response regulator transcription factor n=1 Tax=Croceimicrobium sp. TaxID=2828340 RepID=UPI003BAA8C70